MVGVARSVTSLVLVDVMERMVSRMRWHRAGCHGHELELYLAKKLGSLWYLLVASLSVPQLFQGDFDPSKCW